MEVDSNPCTGEWHVNGQVLDSYDVLLSKRELDSDDREENMSAECCVHRCYHKQEWCSAMSKTVCLHKMSICGHVVLSELLWCSRVCMFICVYIYVCMYDCMYIICMYVCMYVCVYVCTGWQNCSLHCQLERSCGSG